MFAKFLSDNLSDSQHFGNVETSNITENPHNLFLVNNGSIRPLHMLIEVRMNLFNRLIAVFDGNICIGLTAVVRAGTRQSAQSGDMVEGGGTKTPHQSARCGSLVLEDTRHVIVKKCFLYVVIDASSPRFIEQRIQVWYSHSRPVGTVKVRPLPTDPGSPS